MSSVTSCTGNDGCTASTRATSDVSVIGANAVFGSNGKFLCRYLFVVSGELIKQKTGIDMVHVPYRGGALAIQDLIAGNIKVGFNTLPVALPQAQVGSIRIIAAAEKTRLPELPDTPTIDETVPGVVNAGWNGLLAPAGTPVPIIDKLNALTVAALKMPDVVAKMRLQGLHVMSSTPAEFAALIASEVDHWGRVLPSIGIQPE